MSPPIQTRTIAATDQIMAVLRDSNVPLTTKEVMDLIGGNEGTSYIYQILRRQERLGHVESYKMGPSKNDPVAWRSKSDSHVGVPDGP